MSLSKQDLWIVRVLGVSFGQQDEPALPEEVPDEDAACFDTSEQYREYLLARLKELRSRGRASFGMVFGKKPSEHRMALHAVRPGRGLAAGLKRDTGLTKMVWGTVEPDPERGWTMLLTLDTRPPSGLVKKAGKMLRCYLPLPFGRVTLPVDSPVEEPPEEDDVGQDIEDEQPEEEVMRSALPEGPALLSRQGMTFLDAARRGAPLCQECADQPVSQADA